MIRKLSIAGPEGQPWELLVVHAAGAPSEKNVPLVIALHGRSEAVRGPATGYLGWAYDYLLPHAFAALQRGKLTKQDYRGFVDHKRLAAANGLLAQSALRPPAVVTPYLPDMTRERPGSARLRQYGQWLSGPLLRQLRGELGFVTHSRELTGIDGVSLGGMVSLEVGFSFPEAFGRVGAIQPAITGRIPSLVKAASAARPHQHVRLLTSREDPFLEVTEQLGRRLHAQGTGAELLVVPGPHDYAFNRGPGGIELLLFHGRAPSGHKGFHQN